MMGSQINLDNTEDPPLGSSDNNTAGVVNAPVNLDDFDFQGWPDNLDNLGQQNIDPLGFPDASVAYNPLGNPANPFLGFSSLQSMDTPYNQQGMTCNSFTNQGMVGDSFANQGMGSTPFANQGMGSTPFSNQGMSSIPFLNPGMGNPLNQGYGLLGGQPVLQQQAYWDPQNHNQVPFRSVPQPLQNHVQQSAQRRVPQNVQGRTRGCGAQAPQQPAHPYGQEPKAQPISAEVLRKKIKKPAADEFRLLIRNPEEAKNYQEVYLSLGDVEGQDREDIRGREEELIGRLYRAIRHFVPVDEGAGQEAENLLAGPADVAGGQAPNKRKRGGTRGQSDAAMLRLSSFELQLICWQVLDAILVAQQGKSNIPGWYTAKPSGYGRFGTFDHRFQAVEQVLRDSKIMCKSLLDGDEWQARIAWNPLKEAQRKSSNKQINKERSVLLRAGNAVIRSQHSSSNNNNEHNEHGDEHDGEFKLDVPQPPSKVTKTCPDASPPLPLDFTNVHIANGNQMESPSRVLSPNYYLPSQDIPWQVLDSSLPAQHPASSFPNPDPSSPGPAADPAPSYWEPPSSSVDSSLLSLDRYSSSQDPFTAGQEAMGSFFSSQEDSEFDWMHNPEATQQNDAA